MLLEIYFTFDKNPTEHSFLNIISDYCDKHFQNFIARPNANMTISEHY